MPAAPSPRSPSVIAERLRAAGCVFAEDEARLLLAGAGTAAHLEAMVERRAAGEPLEHILGWAELCGLRIEVEPGVFVPRRRTELLVRHAVALVQQAVPTGSTAQVAGRSPQAADIDAAGSAASAAGEAVARRPVVVDLCCGSGAVGAAVAAACGPVDLHAVDIDPAAVRCARRNLASGGGHVYQGDLDEPLPESLRGRVDVLVANAPYVPSGAVGLMPPEARLHEPRVALDGGADGLDVVRRVTAAAPRWLAPGGHLLVEASAHQASDVAAAMTDAGLVPRVVASAELEATVVVGAAPPAA